MDEDDSFSKWLDEVMLSNSDLQSIASSGMGTSSSSNQPLSTTSSSSSSSSVSLSSESSVSSPSALHSAPTSLSSVDISQLPKSFSPDGVVMSEEDINASISKDLLTEALECADLGGYKLEKAVTYMHRPPQFNTGQRQDLVNQALVQSGVNLHCEVVPQIGNVIRLDSMQNQDNTLGTSVHFDDPFHNIEQDDLQSWNPYSPNYQRHHNTPTSLRYHIDPFKRKCPPKIPKHPPTPIAPKPPTTNSGSLTDLTSVATSSNFLRDTISLLQPSGRFSPVTHRKTGDILTYKGKQIIKLDPPTVPEDTQRSPGASAALDRVKVASIGHTSSYMYRYHEDSDGKFKKTTFGVRLVQKTKKFSPYELISPGSISYTPRHERSVYKTVHRQERLATDRKRGQSQPSLVLDSTPWKNFKITNSV